MSATTILMRLRQFQRDDLYNLASDFDQNHPVEYARSVWWAFQDEFGNAPHKPGVKSIVKKATAREVADAWVGSLCLGLSACTSLIRHRREQIPTSPYVVATSSPRVTETTEDVIGRSTNSTAPSSPRGIGRSWARMTPYGPMHISLSCSAE